MKYIRGYVALTAVLILSALFLSISVSIASRAISASIVSIALEERDSARVEAEACVEYALIELVRRLEYKGDESILVGDGSCRILPILGKGNTDRTIRTESIVGEHTYRVQVIVETISPEVVLSSFERVTSF